jgi:hypothetical protein
MTRPCPPLTTLRRLQADLGALVAPLTAALPQEGAQLRCLVVELAQVHADLTAQASCPYCEHTPCPRTGGHEPC